MNTLHNVNYDMRRYTFPFNFARGRQREAAAEWLAREIPEVHFRVPLKLDGSVQIPQMLSSSPANLNYNDLLYNFAFTLEEAINLLYAA